MLKFNIETESTLYTEMYLISLLMKRNCYTVNIFNKALQFLNINFTFYCMFLQVLIKVIDTNNHRPQFSKSKYEVNVPEDTPPETEVLRITATDQDEKNKLTFTLLSSTDPFSLRKFRLDPGTGVLYTAERLDHETMHQHTLTVMVIDFSV